MSREITINAEVESLIITEISCKAHVKVGPCVCETEFKVPVDIEIT